MKLIINEFSRPDAIVVEQFKKISSATAHEAMEKKGYIDASIKPLYPGMRICGPVITCHCIELDNVTLHAAIHVACKGDIIVCTMGGNPEQGPFGELMAVCSKSKGIAGLAIDSGVRDGEAIKEIEFPVFCKGHCIKGTYKKDFGTVNHPINFGGQVINPGDIIIGDDDGLVVVQKEFSEQILSSCIERMQDEEIIREKLLDRTDTWDLMKFGEKMKNKGYDLVF